MIYLKKYWFILFLILIVILLSMLALSSKAPPPPPTTPTSPKTITSNYRQQILNVNLSPQTTLPKPPTLLSTYETTPLDVSRYAASLAQKLKLSQHPQSNYLWVNDQDSLNLLPERGLITITHSLEPALNPGINLDQALSTAQTYVQNLQLNNVQADSSNVIFLNQATEYIGINSRSSVSPATATQVVIPFYYTLNELPFYYNNLPQASLDVIVNSNYQVIKADLTPPTNQITETGQAPTLDINSVLQKINSPDSAIISYQANPPTQNEDINNFTITQVSLEYRLNPNTQTILPYYNLSGQGMSANGIKAPLIIIVKAI